VTALLVAGSWSWAAVPALAAVAGFFLVKEPLVMCLRQGRNRSKPRAELEAIRRSLVLAGAVTLSAGVLLWLTLPKPAMLGLTAGVMVLTVVAVYCALRNRERALLLQLVSAAGLSGSALVAWLAVQPSLTPEAWWVWGLHAAQSAAAMLAVRARLEARSGQRSASGTPSVWWMATMAQVALLSTATACAVLGRPALAVPLVFCAGVHGLDLFRLDDPVFARAPVAQVGRQELRRSMVFSALVVAGMW
jgi:hypothetical protein